MRRRMGTHGERRGTATDPDGREEVRGNIRGEGRRGEALGVQLRSGTRWGHEEEEEEGGERCGDGYRPRPSCCSRRSGSVSSGWGAGTRRAAAGLPSASSRYDASPAAMSCPSAANSASRSSSSRPSGTP